MKNLLMFFILLLSISACGGVTAVHEGCNIEGNLCIGMQIEEPIQYGIPNTVVITVSSVINIDNLQIYLYSFPQVQIEDMNEWVNYGVNWVININANQPQAFSRNFLLPESDGFYHIITSANTSQINAAYSLVIYQQQRIGTVYYANTPIPVTSGPLPTADPILLETFRAVPTRTNYPVLTPYPTTTTTPTSVPYPAAPTLPGEGPIEEPYP